MIQEKKPFMVNCMLSAEDKTNLTELANQKRTSKSAVIREAVTRLVHEQLRK